MSIYETTLTTSITITLYYAVQLEALKHCSYMLGWIFERWQIPSKTIFSGKILIV